MRARGAKVTDIVVLVVAADDGVMPQTVEAINHAKAADVPIIVAINKMDRADANPDRVLEQLSQHGLVPEKWGGDTVVVEISALQGTGIDELLEQISVVAELEELDGAPDRPRDRARCSRRTSRSVADPSRRSWSKRASWRSATPWSPVRRGARSRPSSNDRGETVKVVGPSTPVQLLGFSEAPQAGDEMRVARDLAHARTLGRRPRPARAAHRAPADRRHGRRAAGGPLRAAPARRDRDAQPRAEGRRAGLARGVHREPPQARARRREARLRAPRRRRDHRERRPARQGLERHDHRVQRPARPSLAGARRGPGRRDPDLRDHLQADRGHPGRDARPARARVRRDRHRRGRGARDLPRAAHRRDRGLLRPRRAPSRGAPRSASCATARSSGRARSPRCAGSRTTCARSPRASSAASGCRTSRT